MSIQQITTSAALFFDRDQFKFVQPAWLERVRNLFAECSLSPLLFTASGGGFELDGCYVLAPSDGGMHLWGEALPGREAELTDALRNGVVSSLCLDSPHRGARCRGDWRLKISISSIDGTFYVGVDADLVSSTSALLRSAYELVEGLSSAVSYGFAFTMPLDQHPASYAIGHRSFSYSEAMSILRQREERARRKRSADELWRDELMGQKRHLTGLFRGAYAANVVSEAHVRKAGLMTCGIGNLSPLCESLWLWNLSDREIPAAERMLRDAGALVSVAGYQVDRE